jgi:tRNA A-37 threonylcarbamoyl transferase component Bud32
VVVIARHEALLRQLGLSTLEQVKKFRGDLVKSHRGNRDIFRIFAGSIDGRELILYLKRNRRPYRKDGLHSLLSRGTVWSLSRQEWENMGRLQRAGVQVAPVVAYGEECGWLWEKYSFLVTEAAPGQQSLEQFLRECPEQRVRRAVLDALARTIRRMHEAGLATPDLFTRHLFVDSTTRPPSFYLIDMARLDCRQPLTEAMRARDLAALHVTAPLRFVSTRERLRFLRVYEGRIDRRLLDLIGRRADHLLRRRKFRDFAP